jgi:hypothetical protein
MAIENGSDAGLGNGDIKFLELADDAQVSPAGVLRCHPQDQLDRLLGQGRATSVSVGIRPALANKGTMPSKNGLGRDDESRPSLTRDQTSEGTDEGSI